MFTAIAHSKMICITCNVNSVHFHNHIKLRMTTITHYQETTFFFASRDTQNVIQIKIDLTVVSVNNYCVFTQLYLYIHMYLWMYVSGSQCFPIPNPKPLDSTLIFLKVPLNMCYMLVIYEIMLVFEMGRSFSQNGRK